MRSLIFFFCLIIFVAVAFTKGHQENELAKGYLRLKLLLKDCSSHPRSKSSIKTEFLQQFRYCLQKRALSLLDNVFMQDVIPITDGIELVRFKITKNSTAENKSDGLEKSRDNLDKTWSEVILERVTKVFRTHVLKFDIDAILKSLFPTNSSAVAEGRRRGGKRRYGNIMPLMATGLLLMGSVLIPMGFQFLAVLGGKALLLAKMALILSSIQGLKKIATSGMNYGFYQSTYPEQWHERSQLDPTVFNPPPPYSTYYHP